MRPSSISRNPDLRFIASSYMTLTFRPRLLPSNRRSIFHAHLTSTRKTKQNKVASCGDDSNVRVSDLRSRSSFGVSHRLDGVHDGPCHTVRWHPFDANILLSAGLDSTIKLHDLRSLGAPLHVFRGHCPYALARRVVYGTRRRRQVTYFAGGSFLVLLMHIRQPVRIKTGFWRTRRS